MPLDVVLLDSGMKSELVAHQGQRSTTAIGDELLFPDLPRDARARAPTSSTRSSAGPASASPATTSTARKRLEAVRLVPTNHLARNSQRDRHDDDSGCSRRHASSRHQARTTANKRRRTAAMTYRVRNIAIAVALAVVAALLTTFYVTNYKKSVQSGEAGRDRLRRRARHPDRHVRLRRDRPQVDPERGDRPAQRRAGRDLRPAADRGVLRRPAALRGRAGEHQPLPAARRAGPACPAQGQRPRLPGARRRAPAARRHAQVRRPRRRRRHVGVPRGHARCTSAASSCATCSSCAPPTRARSRARSRAAPTCRSTRSSPSPTARRTSSSGSSKNGDWSLQLRGVADVADSPESLDSSGSLLQDGMNPTQLRKGMGQIRRSSRR